MNKIKLEYDPAGKAYRIAAERARGGEKPFKEYMKKAYKAIKTAQPAPKKGKSPAIWDLVIADMVQRDKTGKKKYGVRLQADNGRDSLKDAYEEILDLAVYLRAEIYKRDNE